MRARIFPLFQLFFALNMTLREPNASNCTKKRCLKPTLRYMDVYPETLTANLNSAGRKMYVENCYSIRELLTGIYTGLDSTLIFDRTENTVGKSENTETHSGKILIILLERD